MQTRFSSVLISFKIPTIMVPPLFESVVVGLEMHGIGSMAPRISKMLAKGGAGNGGHELCPSVGWRSDYVRI